ncbi:TPA: ead/Ea22-like family protein [Escherichia coli]|nr:ead/Ea22-like family protein [Escherichia coli]HAJ3444790.1 ead/Ea22-like family protein [Escherichia coli]HAJ3448036.1 ead/Ea22-like family protein [Escherichia coli]HBC6164090.1 ead/Ea22-like family protein [Escherichia coli]HBN2497476.1 ead/Ea22-like family protein [Escherichia coli]
MIKINYHALREAAEKAGEDKWQAKKINGDFFVIRHGSYTRQHGYTSYQPIAEIDCKPVRDFVAKANPATVLALLDERERNQQYIKRRDQENEDIALTVGKLRVELEETKSKLNEQREYYEGVISDGSNRIAELEKSEEQLINERDHAESALADMYFAATGDRPEWSNWFGFSDAVDAVVDRIADLEAKQPSPVVPEGLVKAVRFYEQVKRENPSVETGAWKDAIDWVLKEACQAVNIGIKGE